MCQDCVRLDQEARRAALALTKAENALGSCHLPISTDEWAKRKAAVRQAQQDRENAEERLETHRSLHKAS
jgi:hypothetical protein